MEKIERQRDEGAKRPRALATIKRSVIFNLRSKLIKVGNCIKFI